uniref:Uncharacterized protein n=1 Tax=Anguilla anguilla TaxID=7936 RepID=A0A0E9X3U8_ANGAN
MQVINIFFTWYFIQSDIGLLYIFFLLHLLLKSHFSGSTCPKETESVSLRQ